jgi:hypothetical protein
MEPETNNWILFGVQHENAFGGEGISEGWLIVTQNETTPLALVAFVFFEEGLEKKDEAFGVAKAIRDNPKIADRCSGRVLDLRGRGRRDSTQAVPPFLYGLLWARVDDEGNHDPASFDQVAFYCPVMLARMLDYQPTLPVAVPSLDDGSNSTPESTPVDPPSDPDPAQPYHAELRRWLDMSVNNPKSPHYLGDRTFGIYEAQGEDFSDRMEQGVGPLVATLTVEPRIDIESAARMAGLICSSPDLWRELRDQNRHRPAAGPRIAVIVRLPANPSQPRPARRERSICSTFHPPR